MKNPLNFALMYFKRNFGVTKLDNRTSMNGQITMMFCSTSCHDIQSVVRVNVLIPTLELNLIPPFYISFDNEIKLPLSFIDIGIDMTQRFLPACLSILVFF